MEYVTETYRKCLRIVQIEHVDAVRNLSKIAAVDGIDAFIVGPNDLSASVGLIGQVRHPNLIRLYEEIADVLKQHGKPFGVSTGFNEDFLRYWKGLGATILFAGNDVGYVYEGAASVRKGLFEISES